MHIVLSCNLDTCILTKFSLSLQTKSLEKTRGKVQMKVKLVSCQHQHHFSVCHHCTGTDDDAPLLPLSLISYVISRYPTILPKAVTSVH